jgi:hypothetical protein
MLSGEDDTFRDNCFAFRIFLMSWVANGRCSEKGCFGVWREDDGEEVEMEEEERHGSLGENRRLWLGMLLAIYHPLVVAVLLC